MRLRGRRRHRDADARVEPEALGLGQKLLRVLVLRVGRDKGETDVTFTCPQADLVRCTDILENRRDSIGYNRLIPDTKVTKISVVGVGMKSHAGVASTMFSSLADRKINIQAISTSEIKVSVLIDEDETELAVRVLHTAYGLDAE